jgi:hypothetical protein
MSFICCSILLKFGRLIDFIPKSVPCFVIVSAAPFVVTLISKLFCGVCLEFNRDSSLCSMLELESKLLHPFVSVLK